MHIHMYIHLSLSLSLYIYIYIYTYYIILYYIYIYIHMYVKRVLTRRVPVEGATFRRPRTPRGWERGGSAPRGGSALYYIFRSSVNSACQVPICAVAA